MSLDKYKKNMQRVWEYVERIKENEILGDSKNSRALHKQMKMHLKPVPGDIKEMLKETEPYKLAKIIISNLDEINAKKTGKIRKLEKLIKKIDEISD